MQKTVMIVEDEYLIAMDIQLTLEAAGWRVIGPGGSVREALRALADELPSIALLDVNLGTEMVTPVAEALQARGVPFAVASAYDKPERYGGQILAAVPNVGKPANRQHMLDTLDALAGSHLGAA